jgi:hypothetical protein
VLSEEADMRDPFWKKTPDAPFATLVRIAGTYCHPEADEDAYDDLKTLARRGDRQEMADFKIDLRKAIVDPSELPEWELYREVQFDDGSTEKFLRRLWRDLYPDEPVPEQR